jgi:hypothetical protein
LHDSEAVYTLAVVRWSPGREAVAKRIEENELYSHHWSTLRTLWKGCRAGVAADAQAEVDALFPENPDVSADAAGWSKLNFAEQCVGAHLTDWQLAVEYRHCLDLAKGRDLPSFAFYEDKAKLFETPPPAGATLEERRAVYLSLLDSLQASLIETRFRRRLRRETAARLFKFGIGVVLIALLPLVIYLTTYWRGPSAEATKGYQVFSGEPGFPLMMVVAFGILGAFFSRVLSFQAKLATMSFEDVVNLYQWRMLVLRLLYGMIGAVMFYYVLRGGLVGGTAFPDLSKLAVGEQTLWKADASGGATPTADGKLQLTSLTILAPTVELAKLLIWSFLAGFSERLVPDTLARTEAQASKNTLG